MVRVRWWLFKILGHLCLQWVKLGKSNMICKFTTASTSIRMLAWIAHEWDVVMVMWITWSLCIIGPPFIYNLPNSFSNGLKWPSRLFHLLLTFSNLCNILNFCCAWSSLLAMGMTVSQTVIIKGHIADSSLKVFNWHGMLCCLSIL